jgi:hypothetical protein
MIKDFQTYINEGLFDRNQSEFSIKKTDKGVEQIYIPKTKAALYDNIKRLIDEQGGTDHPNLNNIDISELHEPDCFDYLFSPVKGGFNVCPDISSWKMNKKCSAIGMFAGNNVIKEFVVPEGITQLGEQFFKCTSLESVVIPNGVSCIRNHFFQECNKLTSVVIPETVTIIENGAFFECSGLTSIELPNSITQVGEYIFWGCKNLKHINIPKDIRTIKRNMFSFCTGLESIEIPDSIKGIDDHAFSCCGLKSIVIPNGVTYIGPYAFYECFSLEHVEIPDSVRKIGDDAFESCRNLKSLKIPYNCKIDGRIAPLSTVTRRHP